MHRLAQCYARLGSLSPWARRSLAVLLGALGALAFAPVNAIPAMAVALVGLFWLIQSAPTRRRAFNVAWFWGFGHFAAGNFWIANSFLIDAARFGWMMPPVIGGLAAFLALYPGLVGAALWRRDDLSPGRILAFAALFTIGEWLRGHVLTGYPWNLTAYVWDASVAMMQSVALWGAWGLGFVTVLVFTLPAMLGAATGRRQLLFLGGGLALLAGLWLGGSLRLDAAASAHVPDVRLRIVQANISQAERMLTDPGLRHLEKHVALTRMTPGFGESNVVVWPESGADFFLERKPDLRQFIATAVPPGGTLLTGTIRGWPETGKISEIWNSLTVLDGSGNLLATADKAHLVPLGEYVPLRDLFPFINKLTPGSMDFSAAAGPQTIAVPGAPDAGPLICYEVIFPGAVTNPVRPQWLVNITNDGWFGISPGPYQHFVAARFRSVEEGLPMVRAANTGISGIIDSYGRIEAISELGTEAVLDGALPVALPATVFARWGLWPVILLVTIGIIPLLLQRLPR
ncbi:apolipoprotein N-acyltransferase [Dongia mobilis]|uniref:Apolipoprotein N-acyltransferase n=1 Tax=Dongia mobilis TaxID=578943 RepID=A0A4R6WL79_9PROT|nr:apolipoprotein N-acyltransferase [Dongia mobilis]TDQ78593.1 apolipoprotein N-acyltransferase [Dongia mobilis]